MLRFYATLLLSACELAFVAAPAGAQKEPKPAAKKTSSTEAILEALEQEVQFKESANVNDIPLAELLNDLSKRHGVPFVINADTFKAAGSPSIAEEKITITAARVRGQNLRQFLTGSLKSIEGAYLIRDGAVEIVTALYAADVSKSTKDEDGWSRLTEPLVSVIFRETPLNDAVTKVAEMYDLTVVVSAQVGDAKTTPVAGRFLNTPADRVIETLALQSDLRVIRRGSVYLITSKKHADELFREKLNKERQKLELEKMRPRAMKPPEKSEFNLSGNNQYYFRIPEWLPGGFGWSLPNPKK